MTIVRRRAAEMRRVLAEVVPADRAWHPVETVGPVVHVEALSESDLKVWTEDTSDRGQMPARLYVRAFATGEEVEGSHVATAVTGNGVAWHLYWRSAR